MTEFTMEEFVEKKKKVSRRKTEKQIMFSPVFSVSPLLVDRLTKAHKGK